MNIRAALARMHEPRPDFVSVSSLLALFQDSTATVASPARRPLRGARPGATPNTPTAPSR